MAKLLACRRVVAEQRISGDLDPAARVEPASPAHVIESAGGETAAARPAAAALARRSLLEYFPRQDTLP